MNIATVSNSITDQIIGSGQNVEVPGPTGPNISPFNKFDLGNLPRVSLDDLNGRGNPSEALFGLGNNVKNTGVWG